MTLDQARTGRSFLITGFTDEITRLKGLQFGLSEGTLIVPLVRIPGGGPTVISVGGQRLALGRSVCRTIQVTPRGEGCL